MATVAPGPRVSAPSTGRSSHPYTCNTCQVAFKGSDLQRTHMQSDWHRYNLKRRVASLPPLTSEIFAEKVLANQASAAATAAKAAFEKICAACQRTYFSENAYENHLKSQKHKTKLAQLSNGHQEADTETETASMVSSAFSLGDPIPDVKSAASDTEDPVAEAEFAKVVDGLKDTSLEEQEEDGDPVGRRPSRPHHSADVLKEQTPSLIASSSTATPLPTPSSASTAVDPTTSCLFCNDVLPDLEHNVSHMSKTHGLFIPEQAYLVDMPGLLSHLHERVRILHECLYCGQTKHTTTGVQTHMRDKGHCMIAFESDEEMIEVGEFYDFTSTYSDNEDSTEDEDYQPPAKQGGVKLGAERAATYATLDEDGEGVDEDEWESDDDSGSREEGDNVDVSMPDAISSRHTRPANRAYLVDNELHLPSGRTAGHRSLAKYYRQNLHSYPTPAARLQQQQQLLEMGEAGQSDSAEQSQTGTDSGRGRSMAVSRANGGLGLLGATDAKKREARAIEAKDRKRVERQQTRYQWGNEKRANMQKHYRDPLLQ